MPSNSFRKTPIRLGEWRERGKLKPVVSLRACLHEGGGPQLGEVTFGGSLHLSRKHDQIKMRDYMDTRVTSPTGGPPPSCK